jgi:NAD(P)-dependent dehydrogenase (short-subunit alcohol dehydrogenase family)
MSRSSKQRALVTGAGSGIGRATAMALYERGYEVIAADIDPARLTELPLLTQVVDITDVQSVAEAAAAAAPTDVLVNVAGIGLHAPVEKTPLAMLERIMDVNFYGPLRMIQAVLPSMRERRTGTIINVGSGAGRHPGVLTGGYSASKAALDILSEALAHEVAEFGVRVVMALPGAVRSNFATSRMYAGLDEPPYDQLALRWRRAAETMLVHGDEPEDFAAVILEALDGHDAGRFRYGAFREGDDRFHERSLEIQAMLGRPG